MIITRRRVVTAAIAALAIPLGPIGSPTAIADPNGCLPLNGAQQNANSFLNTNYFGITYASNVDYWYRDGAVNWHKTVDGGSLNTVHNDTTGAVPASPGGTVTIPGATASRPGADDAPLIVTVCSK